MAEPGPWVRYFSGRRGGVRAVLGVYRRFDMCKWALQKVRGYKREMI